MAEAYWEPPVDPNCRTGTFRYYIEGTVRAQIDYNYLYTGQVTICRPEQVAEKEICRPIMTKWDGLRTLGQAVMQVEGMFAPETD